MAGEGKVVPEGVGGKDIVAIVAAEADFGVEHNNAHQRGQSHREHEKSPPMSIEKGVEPLGERGSVRGFHCLLALIKSEPDISLTIGHFSMLRPIPEMNGIILTGVAGCKKSKGRIAISTKP